MLVSLGVAAHLDAVLGLRLSFFFLFFFSDLKLSRLEHRRGTHKHTTKEGGGRSALGPSDVARERRQ
jgi:hypothetical protein